MGHRTWAAAAALAIGAGGAAAQGFEGAEISAEILGFSDDFDLGETRYAGGLELGVAGALGVAGNLSYHGVRGFDRDGRNLTLHGLYDLGGITLGAFYGRDSLGEEDGDVAGIEAAAELMGAQVDGALGSYDLEGASGTLLSGRASYDFAGFGAEGTLGRLSGDIEGTRVALGGTYALALGPELFAELGRVERDGGDGETYLSLGARIEIGPNRGTTFDSRGIREILPGF